MAIKIDDHGTTITGDDIDVFRLVALRRLFRMEINTGLKRSNRGPSTLSIVNSELGTNHRSKVKAYNDLNARMVQAGAEDVPL